MCLCVPQWSSGGDFNLLDISNKCSAVRESRLASGVMRIPLPNFILGICLSVNLV